MVTLAQRLREQNRKVEAMANESEVLNVADLAKMLGRTEAAIRASVNRDSADIPPRLLIGRRLCWLRATVNAWLREHEQSLKPAKAGGKGKAAA